jgi:PAS domain S-box-containing protein
MESASAPLPRILVVHPAADVRKRIVKELKRQHEVKSIGTVRSALRATNDRAPDVIFCAADLLSLHDWQLLHQLRSHQSLAMAPIIILSSPDEEGQAEQVVRAGLAAGADDFLRAPFGGPELLARINAHLRTVGIRKQIEAELREREDRLRASLTASGAGAYRWDYSTGKVQWDESLDELMGYSAGQTLNSFEKFLELLHPDDREEVDRQCKLCLSSGADLNVEYRLKKRDGTYLWLHDRARTVRGAAGKPLFLAGACIDVTDRKRDELRRLFLLRLDEALRPLSDAAEITATAAQMLGMHLDVDRCVYADVMPDEDAFENRGNYCRGVVSVAGRFTFRQFGAALLQQMRANQPQVVDDVRAYYSDPENYASYERIQTRASICVPLHKNGRLVGAMAVHQQLPRQWRADEVELVHFVVARCWEAMERARVARSLKESEARFRQLADTIPMMVWESQPDGTVDYYNERWYEFTGLDRSSIGDPSWEPILHPDDIQNVSRMWYESVRTGQPYEIEARLKDRSTGGYRWHQGRALPFKDANGNIVRWFGTNTDIHDAKLTEQALRTNEERLQAIIEATPECVSLIARDGALLQINRSGLSMIGADSEDAVRGVPALELVAPEHRQKWMENHERVCMGEKLCWEFEIVRLDGERRWMETNAVAVNMPGGERAHLGVTRDVTGRKRTDAEREQILAAERAARAEAEQTGRIKDEFLATLSHELRTPLNAILGYATLMQMSDMNESQLRGAIATIERNARLQAQLIEDLLDMNRIISGNIRLDVQTIDLPEIVEAAIDTVRPSAQAKSIRLQTSIGSHISPVRGDPARIQQVVWNLLSNAVKFTPKGGAVQVAVQPVESHVEISVSDTGEGIALEFLPHVFDRFRQADSSTTRRYGGLGLGLSIVKHLIELHGGAIRATSPGIGHGAAFVVSLPILELQDSEQLPPLARSEPPIHVAAPAMIDLTGVDVLAVDDEPDACGLVKHVLEGCHARVQTAASAREALQFLQQRSFHVLVSDIGMPVEDGYDLMRTIRSLDGSAREVRAVALTAFARSEDRRRAALAGYHTHLAKPVEAGELIAIVANLAGRTGSSNVILSEAKDLAKG